MKTEFGSFVSIWHILGKLVGPGALVDLQRVELYGTWKWAKIPLAQTIML